MPEIAYWGVEGIKGISSLSKMGCSQNYGPLLAIDYMTAPNKIPRWDPNFGNYPYVPMFPTKPQ